MSKIDLFPYVDFSLEKAANAARAVNPRITILRVSGRTGEGLSGWYAWLKTAAIAACDAAI